MKYENFKLIVELLVDDAADIKVFECGGNAKARKIADAIMDLYADNKENALRFTKETLEKSNED